MTPVNGQGARTRSLLRWAGIGPPCRRLGVCRWLLGLLLVTACAGAYGSLQRSSAVGRAFERSEVLEDHRYYTAGSEAQPTAIMAIRRDYTLETELWRSVDMTPDMLERLVDAMTQQLGFSPAIMGSAILDPRGRQIGVWYSPVGRTTIRFGSDNVITVSLPGPGPRPPFIDRAPGRWH